MVAVYDTTILLSIGLATVLGVVFAVAVTFLGRSLQQAREAEEQEELGARATAETTISKIQQTLQPGNPQDTIGMLQKQLQEAKKAERKRRRQRRLRRQFTGPHLLEVTGSVVVPGGLFVLAAIASAMAKAYSDDAPVASVGWWVASLVALGIGITFLLLTLREVERVSATSEDVNFKRQVEAMKQAKAEREKETQPICEVTCEEGLPIQMVSGKERSIRIRLAVRQGGAVHNVQLRIYVPPGFSIIDPAGGPVPDVRDVFYRGWTIAEIPTEPRLVRGMLYMCSVKIKAAEEPGTYRIGYSFTSEEYEYNTAQHTLSEISVEVLPF